MRAREDEVAEHPEPRRRERVDAGDIDGEVVVHLVHLAQSLRVLLELVREGHDLDPRRHLRLLREPGRVERRHVESGLPAPVELAVAAGG